MERKLVQIRFNMQLPAIIIKKTKWYVASCPALDIVSQGKTEEEAKYNLIEAVTVFMISCHECGVLDSVLKQCGFVPDFSHSPASQATDKIDYINVPLPFIIDMGKPHRCHA